MHEVLAHEVGVFEERSESGEGGMTEQLSFDLGAPEPAHIPDPVIRARRLTKADATEGRTKGHAGASRAAERADKEVAEWQKRAYEFFLEYGRKNGGEFSTEDVRHAAKGVIPEPSNPRCWGAVPIKAKRDGFIKFSRFTPSKDPKSHGCPGSAWLWVGGH